MLCRVCLSSDRQVSTFNNTVLQQVWQKLTNAELNINDGKPLEVCYICCAHLKKSYQLMQKASKAEALLTVLVENGLQHTHNVISKISSLVGDFNYNYVIEEELKYECANITTTKTVEVKKEIDENNEEEIDISIKEEKVDCWDSSQDDDIGSETVTYDDATPVQMTFKELPERKDEIVLERIDIGNPNRKRKLIDVPQNAEVNKLDEPNNVWTPVTYGILKNEVDNVLFKVCAPKNEEVKSQNVFPQTGKEQTTRVSYNITDNEISKQNLQKSTTAVVQISLLPENHKENHMQYKHIKMKKFSCHMCQYKCVKKGDLNVHLRKHTKEKPYTCDLCDYRCSQKNHLKNHMQYKHTKEKNFSCHICQYKCFTKRDLNSHLRKHNNEKPYTCDLCDYRCSHKSSLNSHMQYKHLKEKNFSCHICQYKCVAKSTLNLHLRKHTKEKPYQCNLCDHRCSQKNYLKQHMQYKHTKEKNFSCHMCQYKSVRKGDLTKHIQRHTKGTLSHCQMKTELPEGNNQVPVNSQFL